MKLMLLLLLSSIALWVEGSAAGCVLLLLLLELLAWLLGGTVVWMLV